MDISPKLLRDVEFREQRRGYNPDEVDDFLERLAVAIGQLQEQLRAALERADRAERRVLEDPGDDELRRTLVLAQRTVDAMMEEARHSAAALTGDAEAQVVVTVRAAEQHAAALVADAEQRVATELAPLLAQRDALEGDVEALRSWALEVRARMADELRQQLAWLEGGEAQLPEPPDVLALELPDVDEVTGDDEVHGDGEAHGDEVRGPEAREGGQAPQDAQVQVDEVQDDVRAAASERGTTGGHDAPTAGEGARDDRHGVEGGALDVAAADDPFLAELRRAVTDEEPLGPREEPDQRGGGTAADDDDLSSSLFRRRRRR